MVGMKRWRAFGACVVVVVLVPAGGSARGLGGSPVALVTAEGENQLLAVSLPGGKVLRRVQVARDPKTVAAGPTGPAVVVSPGSGTVTLLAWRSLRTLAVLRGFRSPQIAVITPEGGWAYVTDSATGDLSVIRLSSGRIVGRTFVGSGAHHLAVSPDGRRTWVALGERATTIVMLDTANARKPRVIGRFHPATPAHDLVFAPDGHTVWVSSASTAYVSVVSSTSHRSLAEVPAGPAPQHIAFGARGHVFITSGYGSAIELVDAGTRKVLRRVHVAYGGFNVATAGDIVATSSLFNGTISEFTAPRSRAGWRKRSPRQRATSPSPSGEGPRSRRS